MNGGKWGRKVRTAIHLAKTWVGKGNPQITSINFMITGQCNGRCLFCNIGNAYQGDDMPIETILQIPAVFPNLRTISITGGEPFLRKDLGAIYQRLQPRYKVGIITNGLFPGSIREFFDMNPEASVTSSLHGVGSLHDKLMGKRGAFKLFMASADYIGGAGMTICVLNYDKICEVAEFVRGLGMHFAINPMDVSELYYQNTGSGYLRLTPAMKATVIEQVEQLGNLTYWQKAQLAWLRGNRPELECWAGRTQVFVHNSGRIYPCIYIPYQMGNLHSPNSPSPVNLVECRRCFTQCEWAHNIQSSPFYLVRTKLGV